MTYREWMQATCRRFSVSDEDIDLILANQSSAIPDPDAQADPTVAKKALCKEIANVLPLSNVTEGGYSVSWNWDAIKFWYSATCAELGLTDATKPQIRNRSFMW